MTCGELSHTEHDQFFGRQKSAVDQITQAAHVEGEEPDCRDSNRHGERPFVKNSRQNPTKETDSRSPNTFTSSVDTEGGATCCASNRKNEKRNKRVTCHCCSRQSSYTSC